MVKTKAILFISFLNEKYRPYEIPDRKEIQ